MELGNCDVDIISSSLVTLQGTIVKLCVYFKARLCGLKNRTADCSLVREYVNNTFSAAENKLSAVQIRYLKTLLPRTSVTCLLSFPFILPNFPVVTLTSNLASGSGLCSTGDDGRESLLGARGGSGLGDV